MVTASCAEWHPAVFGRIRQPDCLRMFQNACPSPPAVSRRRETVMTCLAPARIAPRRVAGGGFLKVLALGVLGEGRILVRLPWRWAFGLCVILRRGERLGGIWCCIRA